MTQSDSVAYVPRNVVRQSHPARDKLLPRLAGLVLAALLCAPAPPAQAQQQDGTISGPVMAEGAQRPVPGAQVSGVGGFCEPNQFYNPGRSGKRAKAAKPPSGSYGYGGFSSPSYFYND